VTKGALIMKNFEQWRGVRYIDQQKQTISNLHTFMLYNNNIIIISVTGSYNLSARILSTENINRNQQTAYA
jgi:hypothetical protein